MVAYSLALLPALKLHLRLRPEGDAACGRSGGVHGTPRVFRPAQIDHGCPRFLSTGAIAAYEQTQVPTGTKTGPGERHSLASPETRGVPTGNARGTGIVGLFVYIPMSMLSTRNVLLLPTLRGCKFAFLNFLMDSGVPCEDTVWCSLMHQPGHAKTTT